MLTLLAQEKFFVVYVKNRGVNQSRLPMVSFHRRKVVNLSGFSRYILVTSTTSFGAGGRDFSLLKIDSIGNAIWMKSYGGYNNDEAKSVQQTIDGGYIIAGHTNSFGSGSNDVYIVKTNENGDTLWTRTYGGQYDEEGWYIQQTNDNGYIIVGLTNSSGAGDNDVYLIKINSTGDTQWAKTYGGYYHDQAKFVYQTSDSGYIIAGETQSFGAGYSDVYLIKTDVNGDTLWTRTYGGMDTDGSLSAQQTFLGGYIVSGWTRSFAESYTSVYLIKTDSMGNSGCNEFTTNTIVDNATAIAHPTLTFLDSGGIVTNPPTIVENISIIDSTLCFTFDDIVEKSKPMKDVHIYPNPFSTYTLIEFDNYKKEEHTLTIYNSLGQFARQVNNITSGQIKIERGNLANGLYSFQLRTNKEIIGKGKVIIE